MHIKNEVARAREIPILEYDGKTRILQYPANPLSPGFVDTSIADEKIYQIGPTSLRLGLVSRDRARPFGRRATIVKERKLTP
jgi:hypothetical protein